MALIFLNRFLDIAEAIDDGLAGIKLGPIQGADLPGHTPLPQKHSLSKRQKDEVTHLGRSRAISIVHLEHDIVPSIYISQELLDCLKHDCVRAGAGVGDCSFLGSQNLTITKSAQL